MIALLVSEVSFSIPITLTNGPAIGKSLSHVDLKRVVSIRLEIFVSNRAATLENSRFRICSKILADLAL